MTTGQHPGQTGYEPAPIIGGMPPSSGPTVTTGSSSAPGSVKDAAGSAAQDVAGTATEQASSVRDSALAGAQDVAGTVTEQAGQVVAETAQQVRDFVGEAREQLTQQSSQQKDRAVSSLRDLAQGVSDMAKGEGQPTGLAAEIARQAGERLHRGASYLEGKQPGELVEELRVFARHRPGAFLLSAAIGGFAAGRLIKGATSGASAQSAQPGLAAHPVVGTPVPLTPAPVATPTPVSPTPSYVSPTPAPNAPMSGGVSDAERPAAPSTLTAPLPTVPEAPYSPRGIGE